MYVCIKSKKVVRILVDVSLAGPKILSTALKHFRIIKFLVHSFSDFAKCCIVMLRSRLIVN